MEKLDRITVDPSCRKITNFTTRVAISQALRSKGVRQGLKKVRGRKSEKEDGLQLADMVAGAIAEGEVKGGTDYLAKLQGKIRVYEFRPE